MPVGFWNDPDGRKYHAAYFEKYPGVWWHGDYVALTEHGGVIIYGRSDAVLNPGGVRIGTAEIYRQVEQIEDIVESLAIGQQWDGDERIVLFVRLRDGAHADAGASGSDPASYPRAHITASRSGSHRAGHRDPADEERQDRRACRAGRCARARDPEQGSAGQSGSAGSVSRPPGAAVVVTGEQPWDAMAVEVC